MPARYDEIGPTYASTRVPDPRLSRMIEEALGGARSILNVGAGTGAYEPADRLVFAVEPSDVMLAQRHDRRRAVRAVAEALPFRDRSFDAAMGVLTIHHWADARRGLEETMRVARDRVAILTFDPQAEGFWLTDDYVSEIARLDAERMPPVEMVAEALRTHDVRVVEIPADCSDGFTGAFWARPEAYLDPAVTANMSTFSLVDDAVVAQGLGRLREDLASGRWDRRYGELRDRETLDIGYRLVVGSPERR
jgi:SAM-dependent methyltransferase